MKAAKRKTTENHLNFDYVDFFAAVLLNNQLPVYINIRNECIRET